MGHQYLRSSISFHKFLDRHLLMAELLADAELVVIEGAGHLPTLEQPAATNAALATWLSR